MQRIGGALCAAMLATALSACGSKNEAPEGDTTQVDAPTEQPTLPARLHWVDVGPGTPIEVQPLAIDVELRPGIRRNGGKSVAIKRLPAVENPLGEVLRFDARLDRDQEGAAATLNLRRDGVPMATFEVGTAWQTFEHTITATSDDPTWVIDIKSPASSTKVLLASPRTASPSQDVPTVVLITSDTHRADHVSAINPASPVATPHIDALAKEGALFTNCFSSANNTNPSHIALLTGVHPRDVKITNNRTRLHESAATLAEEYAAAGYTTYATMSAFHLFDEISGLGQGFDRMNTTQGLSREAQDTLDVTRSWMGDATGEPVFLWVHLFDVHTPYELPKDTTAKLLEGRPDPTRKDASLGVDDEYVPDWIKKRGIRDPDFVRALYAGEVEYLDGHLGAFLAEPRIQSATLAMTADHGEGLGEQDVFWSHFGVLTPMVHIPLILRAPGVPAGVTVAGPVRQMDVGRTLLNLSGLDAPTFPGRDLTAAIEGDVASEPRFAISGHGISASIESDGWMFQIFMRNGRVHSSGRYHPVGTCGMYHVAVDPLCTKDRLRDHFDRALKMRTALLDWLEDAELTGMNSQSYQVSEKQAAKLAELGYSGGYEQTLRWWAPELLDKEWDSNPWNLAFQGDGDPSLLD